MSDSHINAIMSLSSSISNNNIGKGCESQVLKLSKTGFCLNHRYLIVKQGVITYYRDSPHLLSLVNTKNKNVLQPKGQISARLCKFKKITASVFLRKKHSFMFEISFLSPIKQNKRISWVFSVFNQVQLDTWIRCLKAEKEIAITTDLKEKDAERLLEEQVARELKLRIFREESKKMVTDVDKRKSRLREQEIEEDKRKHEVEVEVRRLQVEAERKRLKLLELKKREKYSKLLEFSYDYQFQKLWSQTIQPNLSYEDTLTYGIRLYKHLGLFIERALEATKTIINELSQLPRVTKHF